MNKRIKSIMIAAMMLLGIFAFCDMETAVYAEGDITVTFHYSRQDGLYSSKYYSMCVWTDVQGGNQYLFFDPNTGTATVTLVGNPSSIGFYVKDVKASETASAEGKNGIVKDTGKDRVIDLSNFDGNTLDVYLVADVAEFTTSMDPDAPAATEPSASEEPVGGEEPEAPTSSQGGSLNVPGNMEGVTQMTSDDPKADYSPSTGAIVIVDLLIIVAIALLSYQIYSRQKNPITGGK